MKKIFIKKKSDVVNKEEGESIIIKNCYTRDYDK